MNRRSFIRRASVLASGLVLSPRFSSAAGASTGEPHQPALPAIPDELLDGLSDAGDLRLPSWGPYTKALAGISHVRDMNTGRRFDLSVFPGLYRRRQSVPTVTADSGCYAWRAEPNLRHYTLRHQLGDLDTFYADITFSLRENGAAIESRFVNRTSRPQQLSLNFLASMNFAEAGPYRRPPLRAADIELPPGGRWIDGSCYSALVCDDDAPQRHLPDNAEIWGTVRGDGFVHGAGLGGNFGRRAGHRVTYTLPDSLDLRSTTALLRLRAPAAARLNLRVEGASSGTIDREAAGDFELVELTMKHPARWLAFETLGKVAIEIDGIALVPASLKEQLTFHIPPLNYRPVLSRPDGENSLLLRYALSEGVYGLAWEADDSEVREWLSDRIERDFSLYTHEHVKHVLDLGGQEHFANVFVRPIFLQPGETLELRAFICHASSEAAAREAVARFHSSRMHPPTEVGLTLPPHTPAGAAYARGIERLAAVLATNVVFPVRRRGRFIRHYTPGRWWDSLYTWDSGFIGLGLLELQPARSVDNLAAYLAHPEDDFAFVHHGSPVPVQIFQLQALWNSTQSIPLLRRFFTGARRMHRFLAGRGDGSTTRTLASGLIRTWDYFYNSGGWDDYPPQKFVRGTPLTKTVTPVINSAQAIRTARLLHSMALLIGETPDEFDADIHALGDALQRHAWNPASKWFSYVRHDVRGAPIGPLLHASGEDFNRGLDGIYPLVAGICTAEQEELFLARLRDENVFWTRCGLSTVDQSAPYFRDDGYWNGAVWMPHQWFFWKTLLDLGEGELAWTIARTALQTWEGEVSATGCCFEHFIVKTGRGAGWHQFGGLSSPLLSWFAAYFRPGTLTGGFDCWVLERTENAGGLRWRLWLTGQAGKRPKLIVVPPAESAGRVTWNGQSLSARTIVGDTVEVELPSGNTEGVLAIS